MIANKTGEVAEEMCGIRNAVNIILIWQEKENNRNKK